MARSTRRPFERDPNLTLTTPYTPVRRSEPSSSDALSWRMDDLLWLTIAPMFRAVGLAEHRRLGPADDRRFINGLIWLLRTGAQWESLPAEFGPKSTLHARFQEWVRAGAFDRALDAVSERFGRSAGPSSEAAAKHTFRRLRAHWDREPANVTAFAQLATLLTIYRKARRERLEAGELLAG
jgi:transposase